MSDMQLSPHFTLHEFTRSTIAARLGRAVTPPTDVIESLKLLCHVILEPIRLVVGPLHITSGYRPPWLNSVVGGNPKSDHVSGLAADIVSPVMDPLALAKAIYDIHDLPFKQLILEFRSWVHVSLDPLADTPQREVLTAYRMREYGSGFGPVQYKTGLVGAE